MRTFVDTSAFYASFTPDDSHHHAAAQAFRRLVEEAAGLVTTNYVLLECAGLVQKRRGFSFAERFIDKTTEGMERVWVDERIQREAIALWKKAGKRELSLVDCSSFAAMRHAGIRRAFAFDPHFAAHGFELFPSL